MTISLGHLPQVLLLVLARILGVVALTSFYGGPRLSARIRVTFGLTMALAILPVLPASWAAAARGMNDFPSLAYAMSAELFLGIGTALICNIFVAACHLGGMIVGYESALMMAQSIDPVGGQPNALTAQLIQTLFILLVLLCDGHLALLRLLALSFQAGPRLPEPGQAALAVAIVGLGSRLYTLGVTLALPVLAAALVVNASFGLIGRLAPDFNILFLALPFRLLAGIGILGVTLQFGSGFFERLTREMLDAAAGFLAA